MYEVRIYENEKDAEDNKTRVVHKVETVEEAISKASGIISDFVCSGLGRECNARIYDNSDSLTARVTNKELVIRYFSRDLKTSLLNKLKGLSEYSSYTIEMGTNNPIVQKDIPILVSSTHEIIEFSESQLDCLQEILDLIKNSTGAKAIEKIKVRGVDSMFRNMEWHESPNVEGEIIVTYGMH